MSMDINCAVCLGVSGTCTVCCGCMARHCDCAICPHGIQRERIEECVFCRPVGVEQENLVDAVQLTYPPDDEGGKP